MKIKNVFKKISLVLGFVILVIGCGLILLYSYSFTYKIPKQKESINNNSNLVVCDGRSLYDKNGNKLILKGVNAGGILVYEGWIGPFSIGEKDGCVPQDDFLNAIKTNLNLNIYETSELLDYYYKSFFNDIDFEIIKNELNMNCIRLPFYWKNILNDDYSLKEESEAFEYLDWFIEKAKYYGLYIILDLHGVPGSQNGMEHSGNMSSGTTFWYNEEYINAVLDIWKMVSNHYTFTKPELGEVIASYDIINEPTDVTNGQTKKICHKVMDRIYKVIREQNDNHVICMEGCWEYTNLPKPQKYNWENVQYSYHFYNFWENMVTYDWFYTYHDFYNIFTNYNVPVLVGEFTGFSNMDNWKYILDKYNEREYSWTIWTYKLCVDGYWENTWAIINKKIGLDSDQIKIDIRTCTYDEFIDTCDSIKTENCDKNSLYNFLNSYNN